MIKALYQALAYMSFNHYTVYSSAGNYNYLACRGSKKRGKFKPRTRQHGAQA